MNLNRLIKCLTLRGGLEAAGAHIFADLTTILIEGNPLNVGLKLPLGLFLREAHIVSGHGTLAAYLTFSHNFTLTNMGNFVSLILSTLYLERGQ